MKNFCYWKVFEEFVQTDYTLTAIENQPAIFRNSSLSNSFNLKSYHVGR